MVAAVLLHLAVQGFDPAILLLTESHGGLTQMLLHILPKMEGRGYLQPFRHQIRSSWAKGGYMPLISTASSHHRCSGCRRTRREWMLSNPSITYLYGVFLLLPLPILLL